ncbi:DUF5993 family protein [Legionella fairfieldensis]
MMTLLYLFYFLVGLQIIFRPNRFITLQFLLCLFLTLFWFNYHSHLVHL